MTDMTMVTIPRRIVQKAGPGYVVLECRAEGWIPITKVFPASTSAYSALGRMVHLDTSAQGDPQDGHMRRGPHKRKAAASKS